MRLKSVPARQGTLWVQQGIRVFLKRPLGFAALFASFMFGVFVLALIPFIGPILGLMLLPIVTMAFMLATRVVLDGGLPTPALLAAPLRADRARVISMLWLGAVYALTTFGVMWISSVVDGGAFAKLMDGVPEGQTAPEVMAARLSAPGLLAGLALRFGLTGLLSIPFWHAPALVYWDGQRCAQALFSSTLACWRNRGAFTVYGLTWFALVMTFATVASFVFALFGSADVFALAGVPISLIITTVFYASLYFTFDDSFSANDADS